MKKFCLCLVIVLFSCVIFAQQTGQIQLPAGTPLFYNAELRGQPAFLRQDAPALLHGISDSRITVGALYKNTKVLQITLPRIQTVFYTPDNIDVKYDPATGRGQFSFLPDSVLMLTGAVSLIAAILLLFFRFRTNQEKCRKYLPFLFITLLQWGIVLYIIGTTANIMLVTIDDHFYFKIAQNLMHLNFSEKFNYTIGFPVLLMPFLLFASSFEQIHIPFCVFNAMVVMPFLLCMVYLIVRKLANDKIAVSAILFWFLMVLFYHHRYYHSGADTALETYVMKAFPALPSLTFSYSMYELIVMLGYNSVSDTPSCALILCGFVCILYMRPKLRNLALFSLLFGFACLVRLNNILFAPLFVVPLF